MAENNHVWWYGYRKIRDFEVELWPRLYTDSVCDDSTTEMAYAALYK